MESSPQEIYQRVYAVTNYFLINAKLSTFEELKEFDPNVKVIAKTLRMLSHVLKEIANDSYEDQDLAITAFQCCIIMEQIADKVVSDVEDGIGNLLNELYMISKAPK